MVLLLSCISCKYLTVKWASVYPPTVLSGFVIHQPYKTVVSPPLFVTLLICHNLPSGWEWNLLTPCENMSVKFQLNVYFFFTWLLSTEGSEKHRTDSCPFFPNFLPRSWTLMYLLLTPLCAHCGSLACPAHPRKFISEFPFCTVSESNVSSCFHHSSFGSSPFFLP